ncbi:YitT family protein [Ornithinibacillus halophilus]|uniref:YitT family protein n=1 Tax=Ornithinibacillus halophilus TaxID=930117 RepID=UPI0009352C7D|nr:YitT family protein [Ornithinibacillus halophilus]
MIKKAIAILIGSSLLALGINLFVIPNHLLDGGIIGLGLIAKYAFELKPGLTIIALSIPLYGVAFFFNRTYFYNGIHGLLISSFLIDFFFPLSFWEAPPILISSILAGILIGTGIGIMLSAEISSGASDLLALLLARLTNVNAGIFIFIIDCFVLLIGSFYIQEVTIFYSAIMVITIGITTSSILRYFRKK